SSWSTAIRLAPTGSRLPFSATRPTRATFRRTPSSGSTNQPAASTGARAFRPGSTGSWSTCASTISGATDGGGGWRRSRLRAATIPTNSLSIRRRLRPALDKLSPQQRAAVLLQTQEGFTSREIGEVLKCSEATARVHVHRGIAQLRKLLRNE